MEREHVPVLLDEVLAFLQPHAGGVYVDGTLGAGGHAMAILQASEPDGRLIAFDRDPEAIAFARDRIAERIASWSERVTFINANYAEMGKVLPISDIREVDGVLLDLGLSSRQLGDAHRGFSFQREGPLDMRFDPAQEENAGDLVNDLSETELADILWHYGEERQSRRYARAIVKARPVTTTVELADVIAAASRGPRGSRRRIHPATKTFQALRIVVNAELTALEKGLTSAISLLKVGGRLAVISFHSLEDRLVKQTFRRMSQSCICPPEQPICTCDVEPLVSRITRKVVRPGEEELGRNPRSRSARLRVAEKLTVGMQAGMQ